jgi:hypothetical protein
MFLAFVKSDKRSKKAIDSAAVRAEAIASLSSHASFSFSFLNPQCFDWYNTKPGVFPVVRPQKKGTRKKWGGFVCNSSPTFCPCVCVYNTTNYRELLLYLQLNTGIQRFRGYINSTYRSDPSQDGVASLIKKKSNDYRGDEPSIKTPTTVA